MGKMGYRLRGGKVRGYTPKVMKIIKSKKLQGRAGKRIKYNKSYL